MKWLLLLGVVGCSSPDPFEPRVLPFGPFDVGPGEEVTTQCVQITLHNEQDLFINSIELATGPGFHHSNWFYIPETTFRGEDGTYTCTDRDFSEPVAALFGGVLFAQSTQHERELQQFPEGVVIRVPARSKLVTQIHLLNSSEQVQHLEPAITLTPIADASVTTTLSAISFQNHALALPPNMQSKFTVECDLAPHHESMLGGPPDFKIYYGLGHYHELGTGGDRGDHRVRRQHAGVLDGESGRRCDGRPDRSGVRDDRVLPAAVLVRVLQSARVDGAVGQRRSGDVRVPGVLGLPAQLGWRRQHRAGAREPDPGWQPDAVHEQLYGVREPGNPVIAKRAALRADLRGVDPARA